MAPLQPTQVPKTTASGTTPPEASRVSVKLPPFWENKPEIWFLQLEAQFAIGCISTESTKFNYLVSQLEARYIEHLWDVVQSESDTKYSDAKQRLLDAFQISEEAKLRSLLSEVELGSLKPSQLLLKMKALAGKEVSSKAVRTLWLDKLPESVRGILVISEEDVDKQASMADKIMDMSPRHSVCNTESSSANDFTSRLSRIESMLTNIPLGHRSRSSSRGRSFGRSRSRGGRQRSFNHRSGSKERQGLCYYHQRFQNEARKCRSPCAWKQGNA